MSDLDAYRSLFVAESCENHEGIVSNILTLEQGTDSHAIDEIFRSAHSLKGMSASMGFTHMEEICHALEDVFSQIRNGALEVSQSLMDDLLAGADDIELMIDDIETGGEGLLEHRDERMTSLKTWLSGGKNSPAPANISGTSPVVEETEEEPSGDMYENPVYESYDQTGSTEYQIHIDLSPDVDSRNLRAMLILQNLESIGHISTITPQRTTVEDDPAFNGSVDLTLITNAGHEAVETILTISDIASSSITENTARDISSNQQPPLHAISPLADEGSLGHTRYAVHIELSSSVDSKNLRAMLLLQNIESLGKIVSLSPKRELIEDSVTFNGSFDLNLLSSSTTEKQIKGLLKSSDIRIVTVSTLDDLVPIQGSEPGENQKGGSGTSFSGQVSGDKVEKKREVKNIRVDIDRLDHMMNLVEDLVINRGRLEQIAQ
ncbi:MAG: hypothetical protein CVV33_06415, partial [Methanomicrobiales archaeon HGW-Methanomicrobiales-4]